MTHFWTESIESRANSRDENHRHSTTPSESEQDASIRQWEEPTDKITVRDDDGNELKFDVISTMTERWDTQGTHVCQSHFKDILGPDGRKMHSTVEGVFYLEDNPARVYRIIVVDE